MLFDESNYTFYKDVTLDQVVAPKYHQIFTIPRGNRNLIVTKGCQNRDESGKLLRCSVYSNYCFILKCYSSII